MSRQMFARGGPAVPMQEGGMAVPAAPMPEPSALGPQMAPPGLPVDPNSVDINQAAQAAMQNGLDPAMLEGMLTNYAEGLEDLENAEDYETVINGIRGDTLPIEQRYNELAEVVGPEDAQATPESVLTLVQPVMQMAAVDQGIGGLAAEEMTGPVEGPMAEGIMSTVNMGGVDQVQGGPAPVNFNQGGAVQHFAPENQQRVVGAPPINLQGVATADQPYVNYPGAERLQELYKSREGLYGSILGQEDRAAALEDQRNITRSQMLFDVAQGALNFASGAGGAREGRTPAEQLAASFSPVLGSIGQRAGEFQKFKTGQQQEDRALKLRALGSAEEALKFEKKTAAEKGKELRAAALALKTQGLNFDFTRQENESNQDFQMRLTNRRGELQEAIQALQGAQALDQIQLRGDLTQQLANLNNTWQSEMQENRFDFENANREDTQNYENLVRQQLYNNAAALETLKGSLRQGEIRLRGDIEEEQMRLLQEFTLVNKDKDLKNELERMNVANIQTLGQMERAAAIKLEELGVRDEITQDQMQAQAAINKDLARVQSTLAIDRAQHNQIFQASEAVLDRAARRGLALSNQEFQRNLAVELKGLDFEQRDIDRAILRANEEVQNYLRYRSADQADRRLDISELATILDGQYKNGMLAINRMEAQAVEIGSKAKTNQLKFLTDEARLDAYAADELGGQTALFEQVLNDYLTPSIKWDGSRYVESASPTLARKIKGALDARVAKGLEIPEIPGYTPSSSRQGAGGQTPVGPTMQGAGGQPESVGPRSLREVTAEIFNPDGTVDTESDAWNLTAPTRFDPTIDYGQVIGVSRIAPGITTFASEAKAELTGGEPTIAAQEHTKAQATLTAFANDLLQFSTNLSKDRVLKFVQELIEKETENLRPGGYLGKTNADARASLAALRDTFKQAMQMERGKLTEYGGDSMGYTKAQVTAARNRMEDMKVLLNEILAFEKGFAEPPGPTGAVGRTQDDQSLGTAREQIMEMTGRR